MTPAPFKPWLFLFCLATSAQAAPRRIISLLPSETAILAALGALDQVVAVSDAEDSRLYPALPRVGGTEMSWEALVSLKPDLVLADLSHRRYDSLFQRFRLPVIYLPATRAATVEEVFDLVARTGELAGREEQAQAWLQAVARKARALDARRLPSPGPLVYFELWSQPLQAFGPGSLPGHLLTRLGARNVVADQAVPLVSAEAVVRANPDVILYTGLASKADIAARPGWGMTKAVKTSCVIEMNETLFSQAGPRVLEAWEALADRLAKPCP